MARRTSRSRTRLVAACSAGVGMLVTYLFDPEQGRSRRAKLADQTRGKVHRGRDEAATKARYARGRMKGKVFRAAGAGRLQPADDIDVVHAIRQQFARLDFPTTDVKVDVVDGTAALRGQVADEQQMREVQDVAIKVPGVRAVESYLHLPGEPAPNKAASLTAAH